MEAPRTFVPFNDYGKALNRSASPQRYPRPTKPTRSLSASPPSNPARRVAVRDIGASCHDGRHPATAMFDGQKFWATTGLFPQSALARLPSPTRLSSLSLDVGPSVRQVTVSVGHLDEFEDVATVTFEGGGNKRVLLENVLARDVRIRIDLCSESFAIVQSVEVVGVPA
jgi:hypothetical protein